MYVEILFLHFVNLSYTLLNVLYFDCVTGFKESGEVTDGTTTYAYTSVDNAAKRTLRGFSTAVESKMSEERHAKYFKEYFGVYDYADKIVEAAFNGTATSMTNGNVDFTDIGFDGRERTYDCVS